MVTEMIFAFKQLGIKASVRIGFILHFLFRYSFIKYDCYKEIHCQNVFNTVYKCSSVQKVDFLPSALRYGIFDAYRECNFLFQWKLHLLTFNHIHIRNAVVGGI